MSEYHVASFIVRCHEHNIQTLVKSINEIGGAEVHKVDSSGKVIVTAEGAGYRDVSNITEKIRDMKVVVDLAAVYHEYLPST